eukprot:jgi/Galph1/3464/GphlegSOOS_G2165.1
MSTENLLNTIFGVLGAVLLLLLFVANLLNYIEEDSAVYLWINALGAMFACLAAIFVRYWPFIALEATWTITTLARIIYNKLATSHNNPN